MMTRLLRLINEQHGKIFAPQERHPTGEQSAFAGCVQQSTCRSLPRRCHRQVMQWEEDPDG